MFRNLFGLREGDGKVPKKMESAIEADLQRLLTDLETKGVRFLLEKMASDKNYSPLLAEKQRIAGSWSNTDWESWYAYQHAEKLNSARDRTELLDILAQEKDLPTRAYIFRCLSGLCANTNDKELFNFLMDALAEEEDANIRTSIMAHLRHMKKEADFNIAPLKTMLTEGTDMERHRAIWALSNTNDPEVEDLLLEEFKYAGKDLKNSLCIPLQTLATSKSLPLLEREYKKTRDKLLRGNIENIFRKIKG